MHEPLRLSEVNLPTQLPDGGDDSQVVPDLRADPDFRGDDEEMMRRAAERLARQEFSAAESLYRELLQRGCRNPTAFGNLAVLCGKAGRHEERMVLLQQALALDPAHVTSLVNLGVALAEQGESEGGVARLQEALAIEPHHPAGLKNLARLRRQRGEHGEAIPLLERLLLLRPEDPDLLFSLGDSLLAKRQNQRAVEIYRRVLSLRPGDPRALNILGTALRDLGALEEALMAYTMAIAADPERIDTHYNLGLALQEAGEKEQAEGIFRSVLQRRPDHRGAVLNLGNLLRERSALGEAIAFYREAIALQPQFAEAHCNLGIALKDQGFLEEAIAAFHAALAIEPNLPEAVYACLFAFGIDGTNHLGDARTLARRYWHSLGGSSPSPSAPPAFANAMAGTLRVGFLSAEIGFHCVSSFLDAFLEHFDQETLAVELIHTGSLRDGRSQRLLAKASHHLSVEGLGLAEARALLRERNYQILVDTSGFTAESGLALLAERCAPVQVHWIGYHATTGLDTIDWFIGDEETAPAAFQSQFSERLWRLGRPWLACRPYTPPPAAAATADCDAPVLGSFNQLAKVRQETLIHWAAALRAVPQARLLIKDRNTADAGARNRVLRTLEAAGIQAERITFLPLTHSWKEHLQTYNRIDIALDTTPWSSATTGFDALMMGVPMVAIRGATMAGRMGSSIVRGLGRPQWCAEDPTGFAAVVAALAEDVAALRRDKGRLQAEVLASLLFDGSDLARHLESTFRAMYRRSLTPA